VLIELLSDAKIFEILVVCPDLYRVASSFKVMSPLLESSNDGKHLGIMYLIVSLNRCGERCPSAFNSFELPSWMLYQDVQLLWDSGLVEGESSYLL
jgi:hypothetical protein